MKHKIKSKLFTFSEIEYLILRYQRESLDRLTESFNRKYKRSIKKSQLRSFFKNNKITCGRTGCFEKGVKPWNTGTIGVMKANSGSFKKGGVPVCHRPVGSERVNTEGYVEIKIGDPATWEAKHRVIWSEVHGEIPKGCNVRMRDGDKQNVAIDNLFLVSNSEHMLLNQMGYVSADPTIQPVILTLAKVRSKAFQLGAKL